MKVIIKQFPTLLNMDTIENTNYISTSPQYVIYCSRVKESLSEYEDFQNNKDFRSRKQNIYPNRHGYKAISNKIIDKMAKRLEKQKNN